MTKTPHTPAAGGHPSEDFTATSWPDALASYREAQARVEVKGQGDDAVNANVATATEALHVLLAVPAPNVEALMVKLQIIDAEDYSNEPLAWEAVRADIERLKERLQPAPAPSLILAMHLRYEAAFAEYNAVDAAVAEGRGEEGLSAQYERALAANVREATLLRYAILHQVPNSREEACILAFHANGLFDAMGGDSSQWDPGDHAALGIGLATLFDFTVSEGDADIDIGVMFRTGALLAFNHRRFRTGFVED